MYRIQFAGLASMAIHINLPVQYSIHDLLFFLRCFLLRRLAGAHQALGPPSLLLLELSLVLCLVFVLLFIRMPCSSALDGLFPALDLLETLDLREDGLKVHGFFRVDFFEGVGVGEIPAEETDGGAGEKGRAECG
jgi:hypothetical protein